MSLFIGGLAFPGDAALVDEVKIGVLAGSLAVGARRLSRCCACAGRDA